MQRPAAVHARHPDLGIHWPQGTFDGVRVVAGEARGRRLVAPEGRDTRPTLDRVREALFNALGSLDVVDDARVLDLFAGSGALGIEALSRGAAHCTFVDADRSARTAVTTNLDATGLVHRATVVGSTAAAWLAAAGPDDRCDLVLLDPPYATTDEEWATLLDAVASVARRGDGSAGVVVVESDHAVPVPDGWHPRREKAYGGTIVAVLQPPDDDRSGPSAGAAEPS